MGILALTGLRQAVLASTADKIGGTTPAKGAADQPAAATQKESAFSSDSILNMSLGQLLQLLQKKQPEATQGLPSEHLQFLMLGALLGQALLGGQGNSFTVGGGPTSPFSSALNGFGVGPIPGFTVGAANPSLSDFRVFGAVDAGFSPDMPAAAPPGMASIPPLGDLFLSQGF
jgi:hypothetical protein